MALTPKPHRLITIPITAMVGTVPCGVKEKFFMIKRGEKEND
jgi:hypothetical protein